MRQPKIAVVDDDSSVCYALQRLLETADYSVETFGSAESFLEEGAAEQTDCLILDVRLQGASGLQLQQDLLATGRQIPIVFITSHRDLRLQEAALRAGTIDFLFKPVDPDKLLDVVQKALKQS